MANPIDFFKEIKDINLSLERLINISHPNIDLNLFRKKIETNRNGKLAKKVVIVTGASSGIGRATAIEYACRGANVVLASRNVDKLYQLEKQINLNGGKAFAVQTDVTSEEQCKDLIISTLIKYGHIYILVANAGISMRALFSELDLNVLKKLMDVNFWGVVYCTKYALPHLLNANGSLIAVSSMASFLPLPGRTGYCASKSALNGFINSLRIENRNKNIHIMLVSPGFTESSIRRSALNRYGHPQVETPLQEKKLMSAEAVAKRIVQSGMDRKRSITLTFEAKLANIFNLFNPAFVDKLIYTKMSKEVNSPF